MRNKEVFISKKAAYILMNVSLILSFLSFFSLLGNATFAKKYSFIETVSGLAKTSETKTLNITVSADSKEEYQELLTFNGANINNTDVYDNSLLATPNQKNGLEFVLGENKIFPTTFTLRTLFSYSRYSNDPGFKLESDDLFVNRTDLNPPPGTKSISVTKSVAEKIANFIGKTDPVLALGQVMEFNYFDFALEQVHVPVFIKSIVVEEAGIMPTYRINYGDDLIFLAGNTHDYDIVDSRLDIRYSQSIYRNLVHTDALIDEFGADRISFSNNNFLSTIQIDNLNAEYKSAFIHDKVLENPLFITFLVLFIINVLLAISCLILYFRNYNSEGRKHNFISIAPFLISLFFFYIIATAMNFIIKDNMAMRVYLSTPRSLTFILFLAIGVFITFLSSKNKGIGINEENKS